MVEQYPPLVSVIDDDASLRRAIMSLVRSAGYAASGHESAEAFLASNEAGRSACIVTDLQMSGMSGIDLKAELDNRVVETPVIMITARTEAPLLAQARASGAACLLRKPFEAEAFIECLDRALAA
ncbi:MAG TPA: response regulator [Sphingomonas sp.]|nr:response regulator [Sphingomonas sp.]